METQNNRKPMLYETAAGWLSAQFLRNKIPLLSSFIIGLLCYTFAFTNKLVNHDEVFNLYGKGATLDSGRWGLGLLDLIFPNYSMPWIYGILTIVLMAVSVAVIVRIFEVRSKPLQVLLAGCVIAFPSLTGTFAFMYTSSSYAVSFLCAVVAVLLICRKDWRLWIPGLGFLIFSVAVYQSYISVAAGMLVLVLIRRLLRGEEIAGVIRSGFLYVGFLIAALGLYYIATQVLLVVRNVQFNDYASNRVTFSLSTLPSSIALAYTRFMDFFTGRLHSLIPTYFSGRVHNFSLICTVLLLLLWGIGQEKKQLPRFLLLAALIGILPLAINCMYLFTPENGIHTLVLYGFTDIYLLMIIAADVCSDLYFSKAAPEWSRRILTNALVAGLSLIVAVNIYIANISFLSLHLNYEATYGFYTALIADLQMMPEFNEETKIAVIGQWERTQTYKKQYEPIRHLFGMYESGPDMYSYYIFLDYYLGFDIERATRSEINAIKASAEFEEMARYPYYGSIKIIDDILVVKLS